MGIVFILLFQIIFIPKKLELVTIRNMKFYISNGIRFLKKTRIATRETEMVSQYSFYKNLGESFILYGMVKSCCFP